MNADFFLSSVLSHLPKSRNEFVFKSIAIIRYEFFFSLYY